MSESVEGGTLRKSWYFLLFKDVFLGFLVAFVAGAQTYELSGGSFSPQDAPGWVFYVVMFAMGGTGVMGVAGGIWSLWFLYAFRRQEGAHDSITALVRIWQVFVPIWGTRRFWQLYAAPHRTDASNQEGPVKSYGNRCGVWARVGGFTLDLFLFLFPALATAIFVRWASASGPILYRRVSGPFVTPAGAAYILATLACLLFVGRYVTARRKRIAWFILIFVFRL